MQSTTSSKRYAQAVFEIATAKKELERRRASLERVAELMKDPELASELGHDKRNEWQSDLRKIADLVDDSEIVSLLENPKLQFDLKAKLVQERLGEMNPLALNLTYLLIAKGRLKSARQIASEYERLVNNYRGIKHAEVITAIPLDDSSKERLSQRLETMMGKRVSISLNVDPDILGGFIARIDDTLIDCSIRNKLGELKKSLVKTSG